MYRFKSTLQLQRLAVAGIAGAALYNVGNHFLTQQRSSGSNSLVHCDKIFKSIDEENTQDRSDRWQKAWDTSNGKPRFHLDQVNADLLKYYDDLFRGVEKPSNVLIPLCGKTLDMVYLNNKGHNVVGVEFIRDAIEQFAAEQNIKIKEAKYNQDYDVFFDQAITIWKGDFFKFDKIFTNPRPSLPLYMNHIKIKENDPPFQACWDRGALVAIQPILREQYAKVITNLCSRVLLATFEYDQEKMEGPPFSISLDDVKKLYGKNYRISVLSHVDAIESASPDALVQKMKSDGHKYVYLNVFLLERL